VTHEHAGQFEVAGRTHELRPGRVTELVHREVGGAGLDETALPPAVHGGRLHRAVPVLTDDALPREVADPGGEQQVLARFGADAEFRDLGQQVRVDNRDVMDATALRVDTELPGVQVDVLPAEQPQFVLAEPEAGHQRDSHPVAEVGLRGDDRFQPVGVVRVTLDAAFPWPVEPRYRVRADPVEPRRPIEERREDGEHFPPRAGLRFPPAAGDELEQPFRAGRALEIAQPKVGVLRDEPRQNRLVVLDRAVELLGGSGRDGAEHVSGQGIARSDVGNRYNDITPLRVGTNDLAGQESAMGDVPEAQICPAFALNVNVVPEHRAR
jgi:hypothetical protein